MTDTTIPPITEMYEQLKMMQDQLHDLLTLFGGLQNELAAAKRGDLVDDDIKWIVNNFGDLGVKIGTGLFFMYKGESLEYTDDTANMKWRLVEKREFGESCVSPNFDKDTPDGERKPYPDIMDPVWNDFPKPPGSE